jgi:hypothetical protein
MPSSQEILDGLGAIANGWRTLAIAWHVVFAAGLIALVVGWRPGRRLAGTLLAIPLASVSLLAWLSGNPFNGTTFAVTALALAGIGLRLSRDRIKIGARWPVILGVCLAAFGWVYPHFLQTDSWATHLYAAPLGLIPCPTLSAVVGIALVFRGLDSRGWSLVLAAIGVVYGLIGWLRLGVTLDAVLLFGASVLAIAAASRIGRDNPEWNGVAGGVR